MDIKELARSGPMYRFATRFRPAPSWCFFVGPTCLNSPL